jgi:hypothetical protein
MASIADELYAASENTRKTLAEKDKEKNAGAWKGAEAFGGKFLSTMTGGLSDYLELANRNIGADEKDKVTIDQIRKEADQLYKDRSGLAFAGDLAGNVAQFTGVGKGIQLGAKAVPALAKVATMMAAPGIGAGVGSGALTGVGTGLLKEGAHQIDRLGSDKTAAETFNPLSSAARVGVEGILGGVGGGAGGALASITGKGQLAKLADKAIPDNEIAAVKAAADKTGSLGLGATAEEGKLAGYEALRYAGNPKHAGLASKLEGLEQYAGKGNTGGMTAEEFAGLGARNAASPGSFSNLRGLANNRLMAAEPLVENLGKDPLAVTFSRATRSDPTLKALRDQVIKEARDLKAAELRAQGLSNTAINKQVAKDHPKHVVETLTEMLPRATDPKQQRAIKNALEQQNPAFGNLHKAQDEWGQFADLTKSLGRQHATPPPEPSGTIGASLLGGPTQIAKDLAILAKNFAEGSAMKKAGSAQRTMDIDELLKIIGRRTALQRGVGGSVSPVLSTFAGNALN